MSLNTNKNQKFSGYSNSQNRGQLEYGQTGYPQQYAYQQALPTVQSNASHDMSKQVATQQGMYPNAGAMGSVQQQHHQSMGGPAPNPQPTALVQQGQQIRGNHMANHMNFYARNSLPRAMPNMGRAPLTVVANQGGQQTASQYGQLQMVPSSIPYPVSQPAMMIPQFTQQMYQQQRAYSPPQNILLPAPAQPTQPIYIQNHWPNNYSPQMSSNSYFQPSHAISSYSQMPPAAPPIPPQPAQSRRKKAIDIIDPKTGKNILLGMNEDDNTHPTSEKETENADPNICVQFAAQVAATLTDPVSHAEQLSKSPSSDEDTRVTDSQNILCSNEIESVGKVDVDGSDLGDNESLGDLADIESSSDVENIESCRNIVNIEETSGICYKKDSELNSINDTSFENEKCILPVVDSVPTTEIRDSNMSNNLTDKKSESSELPQTVIVSNQDITLESEKINYENFETDFTQSHEQIIHKPIYDSQPIVPPSSLNIEEGRVQKTVTDVSDSTVSSINNPKLMAESKKNKTKKKKDYNKKGESKEGGEMDAFLDKREEVAVSASVPVNLPVPEQIQPPLSLPVTIVDSDILSTIPLPGETLPDNIIPNNVTPSEETLPDSLPQNDISPVEQPSETSSVSPAESDDKENVDESAQSKIILKYSYKEDQWSPLNPEGKKQYDRDFLLQLQSQPMSLTKPSNLPNLDVIKDKAHIQKLNEVNRNIQMPPPSNFGDHFLPTYAQRGGVPRMPQMNYNNRRSLQGREQKTKKIISLSHNVKLHEADNAWRPAYKQDSSADEKDKLKRNVQAILNKLTPQKFETLLVQLKNLSIDTVEKLNTVIDLIFEKAVDEPNFSVPYANMCKHLALLKVPTDNNKHVNFRKLLLTKCQKEFEKDRSDEIKHEEKQKEVKEAAPEKKKELEQEMYEEEKKMRYRQLGNIRFIGELFKLGMLIEPIMHECIKKLLSQGDEESLECLCKLLKTIGKELDEGKTKGSKESMEIYFQQMEKIVDQRLTSARVRFMLQDVIDLKRNNWVPRRDENNPKTIDQIHKEAEREAREMQQILQNAPYNNKRPTDDRDRRKAPSRNLPISEDGWTSSTKSNKGSYSAIDPNKLKLTKPDEVDTIRLGPVKAIHNWGRGSSGGTKAAGVDSEKTALTNRYSALASDLPLSSAYVDNNRRGSQRSAASSRESSRGRNTQIPPAIRKTPSTSKERDNAIEAVKGLVRGGTASETKMTEMKKTAEPHVNGKAADSAELRLKGPILTDEQVERKTKPLIDEFLHNNDFEEAVNCVTELASPSTIHIFINSAINQVLERSSQARHSLGLLLFSLVKQNIITFEHYKKGFACVLEFVDEFALDIPLIWDYLGEILEPMLEDNKYPLTILKDVLQPCIPSETAGMLVSATLHCAAKKRGTIKLGELWRESNLQWTEFLGPSADVNEFIQKHKLEFTISSAKPKPTTPMSTEEIRTHLLSLLEKTEESEEIFDWIDANVSENTEPGFIRALVSAVHQNAIKETNTGYELDGTKLKKRISILTRYIGHNESLELQALYAIQALMNDLNQPKDKMLQNNNNQFDPSNKHAEKHFGVLRQIFDILYDDDVITEESFKNWEKSDDVAEGEGKAIALYSVKSFFTWLKETDSGDSVTEE